MSPISLLCQARLCGMPGQHRGLLYCFFGPAEFLASLRRSAVFLMECMSFRISSPASPLISLSTTPWKDGKRMCMVT